MTIETNIKKALAKYTYQKTICPYCERTVKPLETRNGEFFGCCTCTSGKHDGSMISLMTREYVTMTIDDLISLIIKEG